jgi:hypothetical protein
MAALLPHKSLEIGEDYGITVDGATCDTTEKREAVLRSAKEKSACIRYEAVKGMGRAELRKLLTGKDVVYIYQNIIDARGEALSTEATVFDACTEAVQGIYELICRISGSGNTYNFIVASDHGFIYTRDKLTEDDKLTASTKKKILWKGALLSAATPLMQSGLEAYLLAGRSATRIHAMSPCLREPALSSCAAAGKTMSMVEPHPRK